MAARSLMVRWCTATLLAMAVVGVSACASTSEPPAAAKPATIEAVPGGTARRVRLTTEAARRIDLTTAPIGSQPPPPRPGRIDAATAPAIAPAATGDAEQAKQAAAAIGPKPGKPAPVTTTTTALPPPTTGPPPPRLVLPFAAVIYEPTGDAAVYTDLGGLVFSRERIVIDYVVGDVAVLTSGPPIGTLVVTVGATELYGAELGVGGEELG